MRSGHDPDALHRRTRWAGARPALVAALLTWGLAGCGGTPGASRSTTASGALSSVRATGSGARVVVLPRDTGGLVHLSLFIDAGARDASPPQVATVAAWVAAARAGQGVRARVLPDGTELSLACDAPRLATCVDRLGRALAARRVGGADLARARARLVQARRAGQADEGRRADALALDALLGGEAKTLAPLGRASDDEAVDGRRVEAFLAAHYGPERTLLIGVGLVVADDLARVVSDAFGRLPRAGEGRVARTHLEAQPAPRVELGQSTWVAAAALAEDLPHAAAQARAIALALPGWFDEGQGPPLVAHAFALRGGAVVLLRLGPLTDAPHAETALAYELARAAHEPPRGLTPEPMSDRPDAAARLVGLAWLAKSADGARPARGGEGFAVIVDGGRGGDPHDDVARLDAARVAQARNALAQAVAQGNALAAPHLAGTVRDDAASVVLDNGARLDVRRRPGEGRVAVAIRLAGGAAQELPSLNGLTALLATLLSRAAADRPSGTVAADLRALDATLAPVVDARSFGVVLMAPRAAWREALDLALHHLVAPALARGEVENARLALRDWLDQRPMRQAAWAARAVAPDAPGWVAPWGDPESLAHVSVSDVRRAFATEVTGARLAVAVVGDVPVREVVDRAARRMSRLSRGALPSPAAPGSPAEAVVAARWDAATPRVVVTFRADGSHSAEGARAFARAAAAAVGRDSGPTRSRSDGGAGPWGAWAAVAVDVDAAQLDALPARIAHAVAHRDESAFAGALSAADRARRWSAARADVEALRLARGRLDGAGDDAAAARATAEHLAHATPRFVIGRAPSNDHGH